MATDRMAAARAARKPRIETIEQTRTRFERRFAKGQSDADCWPWLGYCQRIGYGTFPWKGQSLLAHRVAYELYCGPIPAGMIVMHSCDNRDCVNPDHLSLGTQRDNVVDMYRKGRGRRPCGTASARAKINDEVVRHIRRREMSTKEYMKLYGLSQTNVDLIKRGMTWRHVVS